MHASIRRSSLAAVITATLAMGTAQAQTSPQSSAQSSGRPLVQLDLPAQPLGESIRAIAQLTQVNILVDSKLVQGLDAPAIKIRATAEEVLKLVLAGTGLTPRYIDENTMALQTAEQARAGEPQSSATMPANAERPLLLAQADTTSSERLRDNQNGNAEAAEATRPQRRSTIELEEILVTGSHIRGVENLASPVVSVQREDFARWGATTLQEVVTKLPQNFGGATSYGSALVGNKNGNQDNSTYGTGINLRGLGAGSTLVLLNGQRVAAAGVGAFVDVSTIPLSALERMDVIADGASAIYGSDAVGGVVNFVLRDRFEGAQTNVTYGSVTDGSLDDLALNQLLGTGWETGATSISLDYQERGHLDASERGYANALSRRPTYLVPEHTLWSALLNGYQELGETLRLSATLYANDRDVDQIVFNPNSLSDIVGNARMKHAGGTLALDWSISPTWNVRLAHTYSVANTERHNVLTSVATGQLQSEQYSKFDLDMSVTGLTADGPLFEAPGGTARLAFGGEHRAEQYDLTRSGPGQAAASRPLSLERDVDALFAEVNVPLVGEQNALPGIRRLDAIAALRREEYSDFGSTTDPKFGLVYSPIDGLELRSTYGTSFRAPYLNLYDDSYGLALLFRSADTGQITAAAVQVPNPDLGPENATTWTAGFDLRPASLPGLEINATYFKIEYEDRITRAGFALNPSTNPLLRPRVSTPPDPQVISTFEYLVARDPTTLLLYGVPPGTTLADAEATFDGSWYNAAVTNVSGIDLLVSQSFAVADHRFSASLNASYMIELENRVHRTSTPVNVSDTLFNPADMRLRSSLSWSHGPWSVGTYVNYVDDYSDLQLPQQPRRVPSWTTFDLSAAYDSGDHWKVQLAAQNIFDKEPPKIIERVVPYGNVGYDTENANPIGRYVSLMLSLTW